MSETLIELLCPLVFVVVTGLTFKSRARLYPERSTAGIAVYRKTAEIINPLPKAVPCTWSTAVHGLTATRRAQQSEISRRDRRWTLSSSSCTWVLTYRRWPTSRAWTQVSYWACSAVAAKCRGRTRSQLGLCFPSVCFDTSNPFTHLSFDLMLSPAFSRGSVPTLYGLPSPDPPINDQFKSPNGIVLLQRILPMQIILTEQLGDGGDAQNRDLERSPCQIHLS